MLGRAVAFVGREIIVRIGGCQLADHAVALHFGDDRSGGDGDAAGVAVNNLGLRDAFGGGGIVDHHRVDQQMVR